MKALYNHLIYFLLIVSLGFQIIYAEDTSLQFNDMALSDVLTELSEYYSINLIYQDKLVENKKVTCILSDQNVETAIRHILNSFNLSVKKINPKTYVLYKAHEAIKIQDKKLNPQIKEHKTSVFTPPKAISNLQLPYPDLAKKNGFEGSIEMDILIDEEGNVETVKIQKSSYSYILDQAALEYARKIRFLPAQVDTQSISIWSKWKVIFDLVPSDTTFSEVVFKNIEHD